jgi:hypothetical protein
MFFFSDRPVHSTSPTVFNFPPLLIRGLVISRYDFDVGLINAAIYATNSGKSATVLINPLVHRYANSQLCFIGDFCRYVFFLFRQPAVNMVSYVRV